VTCAEKKKEKGRGGAPTPAACPLISDFKDKFLFRNFY